MKHIVLLIKLWFCCLLIFFVRAHKSFIVNIDNIANLDSIGNIVYFDNGSTCEIGPKFKKSLIEEVNNNERSK